MAIANMDALVAALAARPIVPINKASMSAKAAGAFQSLWTANGFPGAGAAPGSVNGIIPTKDTIGALALTNPGVGNELYIGSLSTQVATLGTLMMYDRLWCNSALVGNVATLQSFTPPALTRHTDGIGVEAFIEIYTATGTTATTITVKYTNTADVAGRTGTAALIASPVAGQMIPVLLAAGDLGIKSVQSIQLGVSSGTAGNVGVTLMKRKCIAPTTAVNVGVVQDIFALGFPKLEDNACVAFMVQCTATNTGQMLGTTCVIEG